MAQMTITIPDKDYKDYKKYFLMAYPNQTQDENDPVKMNDDDWMAHRIFLFVKNGYLRGKRAEQEEQGGKPTIAEGMVTIDKTNWKEK